MKIKTFRYWYEAGDNPGEFEIRRHTSELGHPGLDDILAIAFTEKDAVAIVDALKAVPQ